MVANRNALAAEKAEKATTYLAYLAKSEKRRRENQPSSLSFAIAFARTRARFAVVVDLLPASGCEWGVPHVWDAGGRGLLRRAAVWWVD